MSSVKDKLAKYRSSAGSVKEATPSSSSPASVASSGPLGGRFGALATSSAGDFPDVDVPTSSDPDDDIPFDALPAVRPPARQAPTSGLKRPPPSSAPAAAGRFGGLAARAGGIEHEPGESSPRAPLADVSAEKEVEPISWDDRERPAGSSYSLQEWESAEEGGANVVFEMVKPDEIGLVSIPRSAMNAVEALLYSRSLVIPQDMPQARQLPHHASVVHRDSVLGERAVMKYKLVRAQREIDAYPLLNGSTLLNDLEVAYRESMEDQSRRGGRFGQVAKPR